MRRQISNAEAIFYENQEEHIQRFLGRYTCRKPVLVYWESEQRWTSDRKSTRLNSSHVSESRMPSSA